MAKERRLGRGLEALLGQQPTKPETESGDVATASATATATQSGESNGSHESNETEILIKLIERNPFQPRKEFSKEELAELTESIQVCGVIQPVVVRKFGDKYQLVAGERRLRACHHLRWEKIPARIMEVDDRQMAEVAIVENLQRKDLNPLEKATAFQNYIKRYQCSQEDLAKRVGIDRSTVANLIRLLELPSTVQHAVIHEKVSAGHARALLPLGDEKAQEKFCTRIQAEGLSVRKTEELVRETIDETDQDAMNVVSKDGAKPAPKTSRNKQLASMEQKLKMTLGTKVEIKQNTKGKGKLIIHFENNEEFDRIQSMLESGNAPLQKAG